jgi:hypothetical protein
VRSLGHADLILMLQVVRKLSPFAVMNDRLLNAPIPPRTLEPSILLPVLIFALLYLVARHSKRGDARSDIYSLGCDSAADYSRVLGAA